MGGGISTCWIKQTEVYMTTVVGIQGKGFAVLCADSRISSFGEDGYAYQVHTAKQGLSKVAQNGPYLIGTAGDVRAINLLTHVFEPPKPPARVNLDKFMTSRFIPDLRDCFEKAGYALTEKESEYVAQHSSTLLVAIHGSIYLIDGDYSWIGEGGGLYAIGSGSQYAMGSLASVKKPTTQREAVAVGRKAVSIASMFDPHTGGAITTHVQAFPTKTPEKK